jgi:hypothetical protein
MKCYNCDTKITPDDSLGAEVGTRKGQPIWKDVCHSCYYDIVKDCQICGKDDVMPSETSDFILVKWELGRTANRPPGIYQVIRRPFLSIPLIGSGSMEEGGVLFIDRLPKSDSHYDISGYICKECAAPYRKLRQTAYGRKDMSAYWKPPTWRLQREWTRATIMNFPDLLRDIECDKSDKHSDWHDLKELFCLPDDLPTYHEWVLVNYLGVKVYSTSHYGDKHGDGWLVLRPEPRYRSHPRCDGVIDTEKTGGLFNASSLPTFPKMPEQKEGEYHSPYDWEQQHSITAIRKAIKRHLITRQGTFGTNGRPRFYG